MKLLVPDNHPDYDILHRRAIRRTSVQTVNYFNHLNEDGIYSYHITPFPALVTISCMDFHTDEFNNNFFYPYYLQLPTIPFGFAAVPSY